MKIIKINPYRREETKIREAVYLIKEGGIVALPTDTVYGLAVNAEDPEAVSRLYRIKKRNRLKPLILFLKDQQKLPTFARRIPLSAQKLINQYWPGPLTLVFEAAHNRVSKCLISPEGKIGMRVPSHPIPRQILEQNSFLMGTTSANISGSSAVTNPHEISSQLGEKIDLLIDGGPALLGLESTVVDVTTSPFHPLREGYISFEEIYKICRKKSSLLFVCTGNTCRSAIAEVTFKNIYPDKKLQIASAGTDALEGQRASPLTIELMRRRGINLSGHRSHRLNPQTIEIFDLILVMEKKHLRRIVQLSPWAKKKVYLLKNFASAENEEIPDPIDGDISSCQKILKDIEDELEKIKEKLR